MSETKDSAPAAPTDAKPTRELAAANPLEIAIAQLARSVDLGFREMRTDIRLVTSDVGQVKERLSVIEGRTSRLESATSPPPPLTSDRVRAVIEEHPSQLDLETQTKLASALDELAAERAKREQLEALAATKSDIAGVATKADQAIAKVDSLTSSAATKSDVAGVATKADQAIAKVDSLTTSQDLQLEILKRIDRLFDLVDRIRKHRLTKLVVGIATLLLATYAASKGIK